WKEFRTSFRSGRWCWAESTGFLIAAKKWPPLKRKSRSEKEQTGARGEDQTYLLENSIPCDHDLGALLLIRALFPRPGRGLEYDRPIPLGPLDRLRLPVRRDARRRRLLYGRRSLSFQCRAPAQCSAARSSHGISGLHPLHRWTFVRSRAPVVHLASAHLHEPALGDVRGRRVRHNLHHRALLRIPAQRIRTLQLEDSH